MKFCLIVILFIIKFVKNSESVECDKTPKSKETELKKYLFCTQEYDKSTRPVSESSNKTSLHMRVVVKHFDYDDMQQVMEVNVWMPFNYLDKRLKWEPSEYDNIKLLIVKSDDVWMPGLQLYNSHIGRGADACQETECHLLAKGKVICVQPCSFSAICESDFSYWPFDRQNCTLTIGEWLTPGSQMDYDVESLSLVSNQSLEHTEWKIVSTKHKKNDGIIKFTNETYPSVSFNFIIERHSGIHVAVILVPALIMITINMISLWLNLQSFERTLLYVINLMIHFSYIQQISWYVPKNGAECPTVVLFFRDSLIMTTILLVETILIRAISQYQIMMPMWIDSVNNFFVTLPIMGIYFEIDKPISLKDAESIDTDTQNLVKSSTTVSTETCKWIQFAKIIDRLLLIVFVIVYFILILTQIPRNYEYADFDKINIEP